MLNDNFINKLKNKDFSEEIRRTSIERSPGYNYYLCYFVQALLQLVLIDNEKSLTPMNRANIKSNWDNFLRDLSNPDLQSVFDDYKPGEIEDQSCPYKFVYFMLNKLLGKDLFQKLEIDEKGCKCYAKGSITISESLANADHANQIITMGLDYTLDNPTYNNSLFIGQGDFVYAALHNAYKKMDDALKQKLQFLAFELKTKKIKLDQSEYKISDEYKFGRMQEVEQNHAKDPQTGKLKEAGDIKDIKYKVPDDYDTDISVEDLMDLVLQFQTIEKDFKDKLEQLISDANEDNTKNFLDLLIKFQKIDMYLNNNQVGSILKNKDIIQAMFDFINKQDCDQKYIDVYSWLINNHPEFIDSIDINFIKVDLLTADGLYSLFKRKTKKDNFKKDNFKTEDKAKLLLESWKNNKFHTELTKFMNEDVITKMFAEDRKCTNQIIIKFLDRFGKTIIQKIDLADKSLSYDQINEIVYNQHKNLTKDQIKSIDFSKLNNLSTKILFENHLADISQYNVDTFSGLALNELTLSKLATLLGKNSYLDFSTHEDWLQSLYLNELCLKFKVDNIPLFVHFIAKHIDIFSKDQILSLRKDVFEKFKDDKSALENDAKKILNKLAEIEKTGELEKNIVKITGIRETPGNSVAKQAMTILVHIYQKSPGDLKDLKELLSYLIKNNEPFAEYVNKVFYGLLHEKTDEVIEKWFSYYQQMYEKISADDKNKSQKLDKGGYRDCLSKIIEMFKTLLKEDKDPKDTGKEKNINYLCLSKLTLIINEIDKSQDLSNLLSDEQIKSIDIRSERLAPENLYSLLNKFGNKMKYEQFYKLVSSFNNQKIELRSNDNIPDKNDSTSSRLLAKIALISNFINEKEKEFQEKYFDIDDSFNTVKLNLDEIIYKVVEQIYPKNHEKQSEYYKNNTHNRAFYEKSDNTENIHNVAKDDKKILDELTKLNNDLNNKINELDGKLDEIIKKLDGIVAEIKKPDTKEVKTAVLSQKLVSVKELKGIIKEIDEISELKKNVLTMEDLDKIIVEIKKLYFEQELKDIKQKMKEFDQIYYWRKNEFLKLKTNFLTALGHLDTEKVSILFRKMYSNYMKNCSNDTGLNNQKLEQSLKNISSQNKTFWQINPIAMKIGDKEKKYTFNEFFMDGFIKLQSEKHQDGTESNFSSQQKQSMGIINVVGKTEEQDEKDPKKIKVTKVEQYTPEYMLNNLPLILEQFHCADNQLEDEMKKMNLLNLTLKFEQENKKSLERFIDSEKLKFIEDASGDAEMNNENHRYFKAVKKLFCVKVDHILENADLVFETDTQNKLDMVSSKSIQNEFRLQLNNLTQEVKDDAANCLSKEAIIKNLTEMNDVPREHFIFFCGDWICHTSKLLSRKSFLTDFQNVVKKRIQFACRNQHNPSEPLKLTDEAYNLLTAVTLLSGLSAANRLQYIDKTFIDEICFWITGKRKDFLPDDLKLIRSVTKLFGDRDRYLARLILEHVIKNQDYKHVFTCLNMFDKEKLLDNSDKVQLIECISDRDQEIDLMSVISDIYEFNFYPYYGNNYNYAKYGQRTRKLNFEFMQKLMKQLLQKYEFGVYPDATQKATLEEFLNNFIVDNYVFEEKHKEVSNFFKELMEKVPPKKSKEVTKEIIKICSNLREKSQRSAILKDVLDASNNSLEGLELLEVLEQHNYARGLWFYDTDGYKKCIEAIKLDGDLIEKLISDIIKKPLPLTKKEVQRLEWFCENSEPKEQIFHDNQVSMFLQLIQKMPEGSMSLDMCLNLITKFFPTLSKKIEDGRVFDPKTYTGLNLSNLEPHKNDIIENLAYALPQNKLANIVRSCKQWRNASEYLRSVGYDWDNYDYDDTDEKGEYCRYKWVENVSDTMRCEDTHKYQKKVKKDQEDRKKQEEAAEKKEKAKTEGTQKMITVFNESYKNKINKTILTEFKQMYESAKELEKKNNNNNIRDSIENQTQNDNNSIINFEENQNQNQSIDLNSNKNDINTEEIKINENEEGDHNDINDNLNESNIINDEKKDNIVYENKEDHSNNNEIKENEENKINNASIDENENNIKINEIQKEFINIDQPKNNNNDDQSNKKIEKEIEKEVESSGNKIINNDINKKEEPKIDNNEIIIQKEITTKENIIGGIVDKNIININNNNIINNFGENQPQESGNPYTLSACLGILLPIVPSIIFGVKTQHKLTAGDIFLIIVGLIPVISAIVFGIMAYKYNQNILDKKTQENLKYTVNLNENDIEKKGNENNKDEQTNVFGLINGNKNPSQDQKNKETKNDI